MALYTVSSSGQLKIADTGVGLPVSIFYGGITAIASAPLGGTFNKVYTFNGNYNRFASAGQLVLNAGNYESRGLLAGSALSELPLGGGFLATQPVNVVLGHINLVWVSSGILTVSGSVTNIIARRKQSSGQLVLNGSATQLSKHLELSSGQLRVTGNKVASSIRQFSSSGNLTLFPTDAYNIHLVESTTDQLKLTGKSAFGLKRDSRGNLKLTTSAITQTILIPTSTGLLKVATTGHPSIRIGGLATEALASSPIAAGTDLVKNVILTTGVAFYGITGFSSNGSLVVTPIGTPNSDLSQDATLAGSPLATNSLVERRFNTNQTQYSQLLTVNSSGLLRFDQAVKYRFDMEIGVLVVTGQAGFNNNRPSSGLLKITGSTSYSSLLIRYTDGNVKLTPLVQSSLGQGNTLAGAPLGSVSIAGDNYSVAGKTQFSSLRKELTAGQLKLTGVTGVGLKRLSSGQIVLNGSVVTSSLRKESTAGQLKLTSTLATRSIRTEVSTGQLRLFETDSYRTRWTEESRGQLRLSGSVVTSSLRKELTTGQLKLTSSVLTRSYRVEISSGNIIGVTASQNPLTVDNSGLAGTPLATTSLAGGFDLAGNITLFRSTRTELSSGNLVTTGFNVHRSLQLEISRGQLRLTGTSLPSSTRRELTSGQLKLTGTDYNTSRRNEISTGQLRLSGSVVTRSRRNESSSGQLRMAETDAYQILWDEESRGQLRLSGNSVTSSLRTELTSGQLTVATVSQNPLSINNSGLAGSPLASISIAGGFDLAGNITLFRSTRTELSSGNLVTTGFNVHRSLQLELTSGQLKLTGSSLPSSTRIEPSSGNLKLTGTDYNTSRRNEISTGQLRLSGSVVTRSRRNESSSGQLRMAETDAYQILWDEESRGQLRLSGSVVTRSIRNEETSGQLTVQLISQNPLLLDNAGLAGSALATLPLGGGTDLTYNKVTFRSLRNELSSGNLVTTGFNVHRSLQLELTSGQLKLTGSSLPSSTRRELTSGQLKLTGTDYNTSRRNEISTGQLRLSGSVVTRSIRNESSSGNLKFYPADLYRIYMYESSTNRLSFTGSDSNTSRRVELSSGQLRLRSTGENPLALDSSIAGSALAALPLGGGIDLIVGQAKFSSLRLVISQGQLTLTGSNVHSSTSRELTTGQLKLTGSTVWNKHITINSSGRLVVTGAFTNTRRYGEASAGQLLTKTNSLYDPISQSATIAGSTIAFAPLGGSGERFLLTTTVTYKLAGVVYNDTGFAGSSSGNLKLTGSTLSRSLIKESTTGQLIVIGTQSTNARHAETSSGQLVLTSRDYQSTRHNETSSGRLVVTGTQVKKIIHVETTTGRLLVTGTHVKKVIHAKLTTGRLVVTGTHSLTVSYGTPGLQTVSSAGALSITGSATATTNVVPVAPKVKENAGGGSYVYATSWDILRPYFPDDRHILGYVTAEVSPGKALTISGHSEVEVIRRPAPVVIPRVKTGKSLADYIESIENTPVKTSKSLADYIETIQATTPEIVQPMYSQQILEEDEMLLNGTFLEFDLIQDELDKELLL